MTPRLVVVGGGRMGEALVAGLLAAGWAEAPEILVVEPLTGRRAQLSERYPGLAVAAEPAPGDGAVVAVKPADVQAACRAIAGVGAGRVLSIAAGVPLAKIQPAFANPTPVIRVMPNTPCLVRSGMAVLALGPHAGPDHEELVLRIFNAVGRAVTLPEGHLDAVTALSGSGPAFVSMVVEALVDGGVRAGLPRDVATILAVQTTLGTAEMLARTGEHPARLKEMVTSPGGTAIAGVHALERAGLRAALIDAVIAATERSRELGR